MLRLQPTTLTITTRELSDSERRSRYRKHLITTHRASKGLDGASSPEQDAVIRGGSTMRRIIPTIAFSSDHLEIIPTNPDFLDAENETRSREEPSSSSSDSTTAYSQLGESRFAIVDLDAFDAPLHTEARKLMACLGSTPESQGPPQAGASYSHRHSEDMDDGRAEQDLDEEYTNNLGSPARPATSPRNLEETTAVAEELDTQSHRRHLSVYNDRLPIRGQPRTPRQLPEARHQSRFGGAYTAPVAGRRQTAETRDTPTRGRGTHAGRNGSPTGLRIPGFQGLYGGSENADDA
ncbi:hypothetical protein NM208_g15789 [Fusarium decemcellulare]|uniref:Uncharacterized protein n=1 Tax=Fusarium decemcellulare TaxID=57161 RepID=A0ACC1RC14_9HYPO|nr:hypothetical protein NM208_g15789 [Fusarium decemcellulare]